MDRIYGSYSLPFQSYCQRLGCPITSETQSIFSSPFQFRWAGRSRMGWYINLVVLITRWRFLMIWVAYLPLQGCWLMASALVFGMSSGHILCSHVKGSQNAHVTFRRGPSRREQTHVIYINATSSKKRITKLHKCCFEDVEDMPTHPCIV